ncbi:MAG: ATP-binding protein [Candidatus Cloacimonetes bacterium]|nr:ATP-binding protein [Candidatus Cloacimonadota bacterium]
MNESNIQHTTDNTDYIALLTERIKELSCLYQIAEISNNPEFSLKEILSQIVQVIPPAMQYPYLASAKLFIDGDTFTSAVFSPSNIFISEEIVAGYQPRGIIEVFYQSSDDCTAPLTFLPEEHKLCKTISQQIALILERKQIEETNQKLQEQLRHADRLATIGQLAAGIAHEINEPLGTILGFAQLLQSSYILSEDMNTDLMKIINAALHGREVVRKLMLFSRQMPPKKALINLNKIIEDGFYFLESRCARQGVEIRRSLAGDIPEIVADPSQMHQVLVNLTVNAMQAMPEGGIITIETHNHGKEIELFVADTGIGMSPETVKKIFIPFFTTKDINQGTGLGLSVVHGIVTTHNGRIEVQSKSGQGTCFRIYMKV